MSTLVPSDIAACLDVWGIDYRVSGDEATAKCPSPEHGDVSPSWSINLTTGLHNCFSCGFAGGFRSLAALYVDDPATWIKERRVREVTTGTKRGKDVPRQPKAFDRADMWKFTEPPLQACVARGFTPADAKVFGLRWSQDDDSWIIPITEPFTGRQLGYQKKGAHVRNYPVGVKKSATLFGSHKVSPAHNSPLVVAESPLDGVRLWSLGIRNSVATFGTNVSAAQFDLIAGIASEVVLFFDNDVAGRKATIKAIDALSGRMQVSVFPYGDTSKDGVKLVLNEPDGRDPGDLSAGEIHSGMRSTVPYWRLA
jgi:Zn ribbon nucleic-acid-binding protein